MKKLLYLFFALSVLVYACKSDSKKIPIKVSMDVQKLQNDLVNMRLGSYLKKPEFANGALSLSFVKDYAEFKQISPASQTTEEIYKKNFSKKYEIEKVMAELPVKIMKEYPAVNSVSIVLPFGGKTYNLSITREDVEKYTGKSFTDIENDWNKNYAELHLFNEAGRKAFNDKFVKVN